MLEEDQKAEAQQTLDELFSQYQLPFKLSARRVASIGVEEYIVYFQDGGLPSVDVSWHQGQCFKDVFRTAVMEKVKKVSGPLHTKPAYAAN